MRPGAGKIREVKFAIRVIRVFDTASYVVKAKQGWRTTFRGSATGNFWMFSPPECFPPPLFSRRLSISPKMHFLLLLCETAVPTCYLLCETVMRVFASGSFSSLEPNQRNG